MSLRRIAIAFFAMLIAAIGIISPYQIQPTKAVATTPAIRFPGNDGKAHKISYDASSFMIDDQRVAINSGEFHYWRLPSPDHWRDVFQKFRANGFNAVSLYFHWGYHSHEPGVFDFSGVRDIDRLLTTAAEEGLYVIARPGPYIQAESAGGGLPPFMTTYAGRPRVASEDNFAAEKQWLAAVDAIIAKHQLSTGTGSVIAHQVENELIVQGPATIDYQLKLQGEIRKNGITVPLFHNDYSPGHGYFAPGSEGGKDLQLYAWDYYPLYFDCGSGRGKIDHWFEDRIRGYSPKTPPFIAEGQGGAFTAWGRDFQTDHCANFVDEQFTREYVANNIGNGITMHNTYMEFGGTNWGWTGDPGSGFTSYDYGAALRENRIMRPKMAVQKEFNQLQTAAPGIMTSRRTGWAPLTGADTASVLSDIRVGERSEQQSVTGNGTRFVVLAHKDSNNEASDAMTFPLDLGSGVSYARVPAHDGLQIPLRGRDARIVVADWKFGAHRLMYTTGQVAGLATMNRTDTLLLTAHPDEQTETVLRLDQKPSLSGNAQLEWDEARHEARIIAVAPAKGNNSIRISGAGDGQDLTLLISDRAAFPQTWVTPVTGAANATLVSTGVDLVRSATLTGNALALTGDTRTASTLTVYAPSTVASLSWNGKPIEFSRNDRGALVANLAGPQQANVPELSGWKAYDSDPERQRDFDDSSWTVVDKKTVPNPRHGPGLAQGIVMDADDYGFSHGDIWYRGKFTPAAGLSTVTINARAGLQGIAEVWLNGVYVGSQWDGLGVHAIPAEATRVGQENVIAIVVRNNGHTQDPLAIGQHKGGNGLNDVAFPGSGTISWKIQGAQGGNKPVDQQRGLFNVGGSFGERSGWHLPGNQATGFTPAASFKAERPGMRWFKTQATLALPQGQDTALALRVDDKAFKKDRYRLVLFVNGWNVGNYINNVGPQQEFVIPAGWLNSNGVNDVSVLMTAQDAGVGPDSLRFVVQGTAEGGLR